MTFKADDRVNLKGMEMPATIISGPHPTHGADRWLVRKADGKVSLVREGDLSPVLSKREAIAAMIYEDLSAYGYKWRNVGEVTRQKYLAVADRVLAEKEWGPLAAGDKIRILRNGLSWAEVEAGDVLAVIRIGTTTFHAKTSNLSRGYYVFDLDDQGTGWERV